ncbi:hypothetical protein LTR62_003358 [Meristemomyces frigidus]|uniref:GH16 domain-containing protein n=1 Tax=Meristemomyces frigidus TaxID=1508187 RepID=A0AAN7YH08_9PEZI|nr:hypothetical protein LTR62_003358 [Meristemomyces frigidus]
MMNTFMTIASLGATLFAGQVFALPLTSSSSATSYSLIADWSGPSFFSNFAAYTGSDPTQGSVNYVGLDTAASTGLAGFIHYAATNTSNAYIGVDYTTKSAMRASVRLTSQVKFDAPVVLVSDIVHAPAAYGSWPALWMLGDESASGTWPANGGEYDYFENVNAADYNSMTMHTAPGCTVDNSSTAFQGTLNNTNCNANSGDDGCSIKMPVFSSGSALATAGAAFNKQGGGVYVSSWTPTSVTTWLFARSNLPADLVAGNPNPALWTSAKPLAHFAGTECDFTSSLSKMVHVIDHTFCGSWAGAPDVWQSSGAAAATNSATCAEYVQINPAAFKDAYFEIASIRVYGAPGVAAGRSTYAKRDAAPEITYPVIRTIGDDCPEMANATVTSVAAHNISHAHGYIPHPHPHHHHHHRNQTANGTAFSHEGLCQTTRRAEAHPNDE